MNTIMYFLMTLFWGRLAQSTLACSGRVTGTQTPAVSLRPIARFFVDRYMTESHTQGWLSPANPMYSTIWCIAAANRSIAAANRNNNSLSVADFSAGCLFFSVASLFLSLF
jgi:hypothetical protein